MKLKFMTQGQASKDQHRLKEKIQKKKYKLHKGIKHKEKGIKQVYLCTFGLLCF